MSADLDPQRLARDLRTSRFGRSLRVLELTDSTNDDARADALAGAPDGHVVIADGQRAGRGSHGRAWTSPPGSDLYLSIVARPQVLFDGSAPALRGGASIAALPPLTLAVGLGVADAVQALLPERSACTEVKWPTDVWLLGKKCAGVLVEASTVGSDLGPVVIGIGLNVNRVEWADELGATATSLRLARGAALDRGAALCALLFAVEAWVDRFVARGGEAIAAALDARLAMRGQRVRCAEHEGTLLGVAPSGAIRIATAHGTRELIAGRLEPWSA